MKADSNDIKKGEEVKKNTTVTYRESDFHAKFSNYLIVYGAVLGAVIIVLIDLFCFVKTKDD